MASTTLHKFSEFPSLGAMNGVCLEIEIRLAILDANTFPETIVVDFQRMPYLVAGGAGEIRYNYTCTGNSHRTALFSTNEEIRLFAQEHYAATTTHPFGRLRYIQLENQQRIWFDPTQDNLFFDISSLFTLSKFCVRGYFGGISNIQATKLHGWHDILSLSTPPINVNCRLMMNLKDAGNFFDPISGAAGPFMNAAPAVCTSNAPSATSIMTLQAACDRARADLVALLTDPVTGLRNSQLTLDNSLAVPFEIYDLFREMTSLFN